MGNRTPLAQGCDCSRWNEIDFDVLSTCNNFDFCMIRCGGSDAGFYTDSKFKQYYWDAKNVGLDVGTYYIPGKQFLTAEDGIKNAEHCLSIIRYFKFEYPVALDIENQDATGKSKEQITDAAIAFCRTLEAAGYYVSIYSNSGVGFKNMLNLDRIKDFDLWVAAWSDTEPSLQGGMWQHKVASGIAGVSSGKLDLDYAYKDYKKIMITHKLNGYSDDSETDYTIPCQCCHCGKDNKK